MTAPELVAGIDWTRDAFALPYRSLVMSHGPWAWYRLEETAGVAPTLTDHSGNGRDGVSTGTWAKTSTIPLAGAITGDPVNDAWYKSVAGDTNNLTPDHPNGGGGNLDTGFTDGICWELWVYVPSTPSGEVMLMGSNSADLSYIRITTGMLVQYAEVGGTTYITSGAITTAAWHHIVLRVEGTSSSSRSHLYVDGVREGSYVNATVNDNGTSPIINRYTTNIFVARANGDDVRVDEIAIYNYDIGDGAIASHYGAAGVSFDETASYTEIRDSSFQRSVRSVSFSRGRSGEQSKPDPGSATVTVVDDDRRFEPDYAGSPYFPDVKPGRELSLWFEATGDTQAGADVVLHGSASYPGGSLARLTNTVGDYAELAAEGMNSRQGWVAVRFSPSLASGSAGQRGVLSWGNLSQSRFIELRYGGTGDWEFRRSAETTSQTQVATADTWSAGDKITLIVSWDEDLIHISLNGAAFVDDTFSDPLAMPSLSEAYWLVGVTEAGANPMAGDYYWILMGTGTLTDADATTLNALGDTDPTLTTLGSTAAPLRLWTADNAATTEIEPQTDLFTGPIRKFPFIAGGPRAFRPINVTDLVAALASWPVSATYTAETTGARINRILDRVGFPRWKRLIDVGQETVAAETLDVVNALEHIQLMAESEGGLFYADGAGWAVFHDRAHRVDHPRSATSRWTYTDDGTGLKYSIDGLALDDDLDDVFTNAIVSYGAASAFSVESSAASAGVYGIRTISRTTRITTRTAAIDYAERLMAAYGEAGLVPRRIEVFPAVDYTGTLWRAVRDHRVSDRITIRHQPLTGGDPIELDAYIEKITGECQDAQTNAWKFTLELSPVTGVEVI